MKKLDFAVYWITVFKVKVTGKGQNVNFIQMISSKQPNILLPNLLFWCIIMSSYDQNMTVSTLFSELAILLPPNFVWQYIIIRHSAL